MKEFSLARQNKAFPRDIEAFLVKGVQVAPFLGLGILTSVLGYQLVSLIPNNAGIFFQVAFLALLFGMVILDTEPGWNIVLFLTFGLVSGMMIHWSGAEISQLRIWILFLILVLISITGGFYLKRETGPEAGILFSGTFLYLIGWILFLLTTLPGIMRTIWIVLGLVLFTLVAMAVINQGKTQNAEDMTIPLSIQLFVVLFNLFWLSTSL